MTTPPEKLFEFPEGLTPEEQAKYIADVFNGSVALTSIGVEPKAAVEFVSEALLPEPKSVITQQLP